jgi:hypothetical protein
MTCLAEAREKQAAPGNAQRSVGLLAFEQSRRVKASRWVILGSRLLARFPVATHHRGERPSGLQVGVKAAPLQATACWLLDSILEFLELLFQPFST